MARPLVSNLLNLLLYSSSMSYTTIFFLVLSVFSIFFMITFLCGTKSMKNLYIEEEEATGAGSSNENNLIYKVKRKMNRRRVLMMKMLYWRKIEAEELEKGNQDDEEEVLWKKNILMGEKCRPIDEED
ncbi:hypothetical protein RYX36_006378 [Vicia faba]